MGVRRGVTVSELLTGTRAAPGVPHVTGVRTSDGEHIACDLVVDAMGRRSELPRWLAALGARPATEEAEDSGFTYYTRYFRSPAGEPPGFITGLLTQTFCRRCAKWSAKASRAATPFWTRCGPPRCAMCAVLRHWLLALWWGLTG